MEGTLYLCATPIGNLDDITFRVLETLKQVDLIAAEDTRHSIKLLNHFDIHTPMTSYHEYNKVEKARVLVEKLKSGMNIACITDAGTPGISDPGEELVRQCCEAGIKVTALPGAVACVTALIISGLPTRRFCFEAFLPTDKKEHQRVLAELQNETRTIVLYEAPHHLLRTLTELYEALGDRKASICRELTKKYETAFRTTLSQAVAYYTENEPKGECVIVIEGKSVQEIEAEDQARWQQMSLEEHMEHYESQGNSRKEAMKLVAKDRGVSKRDVYQALLEAKVKERFKRYAIIEETETDAELYCCEDAEIVVTAYGASARVSKSAVTAARRKGIKAGLFRPKTLWPFPKKELCEATKHASHILDVEMSMGQMIDDVRLATECRLPVSFFGRTGGVIPTPAEVLAEIEKLAGGAE